MKKNLLIALLAAGMLTPVLAQYKPIGDDGIAASPKHRETLAAQKVVPRAPVVTVATVPTVSGSPRYVETWNKPALNSQAAVTLRDPALRANCPMFKAVTASPKMRDTVAKTAGGCCEASPCMTACTR